MAFRPDFGAVPSSEVSAVAQGLTAQDRLQLERGARPVSAGLRSGALRYIQKDPGERWLSIRDLWANGGGDCEDLAAAVAAERQLQGIPAEVRFVRLPDAGDGIRDWHAVTVHTRTGKVEDPSRWGGYTGPSPARYNKRTALRDGWV